MIVHPQAGDLRLVTQNDHAHFAAELLSLWRADGLPGHPRRAGLLRAVREHDNGWREADAAPRVDPASGRPYDFLTMPREVRCEIWRRGSTRLAGEDACAALLITHHARALHRPDSPDDDTYTELLEELDELYDELLAAAGLGADEVAADYRFLALADRLSLLVAAGWEEPVEHRGVRASREGEVLRIEPFPLAGTTRFRIPCRQIPDRRYAGDADLGGELASARWQQLPVRVAPFSPCR